MAYGLKYQMDYKDRESNTDIEIFISQEGYSGDATTLLPSENPCIVTENNNNEDLFSPIRAKEIRVSFITDNNIYPGVEDFITTNDSDYLCEINVDGRIWLVAYLLPDQITEDWYTDDTNHLITLVFSDNLATLRTISLPGFLPTAKPTLFELVKAALENAIPGLSIQIFDNLYETSFDDRESDDINCPFYQCRVDCRTFVENFNSFNNCYEVLTKILESRNCVLFQSFGEWIILRVPELFDNATIKGTRYQPNPAIISAVTWNTEATISNSGNVNPVEKFMLKSYINALKYNKVIFNYENFAIIPPTAPPP